MPEREVTRMPPLQIDPADEPVGMFR